ncbi:MFS transporter [Burkholderia cepacia]|uniref:MFS transporter n=1 Tax=Burkholderia cepacia TaxID=292 RepID=UPI00075CC88A|nr:MFS transporter [Burkholderia cepacia]KWH31888.1 MFS transporter [Burkholderia cepacia]
MTEIDLVPLRADQIHSVDSIYRKVSWRLLPLLMLAYIVAYLDRINIGYAQLQMKQTLSFSDAVYGVGTGIFFVGYFLFEVPSNLLLAKIGARKTMLRIMVLWGILASTTMFVTTPMQFYVVRFLLGLFEAGFVPGVVLYITYWYPSERRGQVMGIFMSASSIAAVLAGPLCGGILKYLDGLGGWYGWQWLFLVQGLPAVFLGGAIYVWLEDNPADAQWLAPSEKNLLHYNLQHDRKNIEGEVKETFWSVLRDPNIYLLSLAYFLLLGAGYTMIFWMPTLIQNWGVKDVLLIGIYGSLPSLMGVVGMIIIGRSSDKHRERHYHFMACVMIGAIGLAIATTVSGDLNGSLVALSFSMFGLSAATPVFWTLISEYLSKDAAAGGLAFISSLGVLGPAVIPTINTLIVQHSGSSSYGIYLMITMFISSGLIVLFLMRTTATTQQSMI